MKRFKLFFLYPIFLALLCLFASGLYSKDNDGKSVLLKDNESLKNQPPVSYETLKHYHSEALKALRKGEYDYCALMFEKYVKLKSDNIKIYEYLGQVYMKLGKNDEAIRVLKKALELNPQYYTGYFNIGKIYRDAGYPLDSIEALEKAMKIDKNPDVIFELGLSYERINKLDKAKQLYEEAISYDKGHSEAIFSLGLLYLREKDYDKSISYIEKAVKISPSNKQYPVYLEKAQNAKRAGK